MVTSSKPVEERDAGALEILSKPRKDTLGRNRPEQGPDMATMNGFLASGLTGAEYARRHGINYSTFCSRMHRARKLIEKPVTSLRNESPASVTSVPKVPDASPFVRVELPQHQASASFRNTSAPSLVLPGDIRVEGADVPTLVALIRALGGVK